MIIIIGTKTEKLELRERDRERDRQTDRQTDRGRGRDTETGRESQE